MRKLMSILGNIRLTTAIAALVVFAIIGSIAAVSGAIYLNLHATSLAESQTQQQTNVGVAATILERRITGSTVEFAEDGSLAAFQTWAIPPIVTNEIIDSVTRVTKQDASIYVLDQATETFIGKTTSLAAADGARMSDLSLGTDSPAYAALMAGENFVGDLQIGGVSYLAAMQPITKMNGGILGAIFVGTPLARVEATANDVLSVILTVGGAVTLALGLVGLVLSRQLSRPIPRLAAAMNAIAEGNYETEVPYTGFGNEVGGMARAVEVFRQNGLRVSQMTEAEAARIIADQEARQEMMHQLQRSFGEVVDAATAGDFSQRVRTEFPDAELNALAASVNNLVSTFNRGVSEMGQVLAAMANTDLTERMDGDYEGAFLVLKSDINAVADKLTEVVGQLRHTSGSLRSATGEILSGATDLSARTTKQASTIQETSAAMDQLAVTVQQNAQRAHDVSNNASSVTRTAEEGGKVMEDATAAMERITASSAKISNIIGMIDDIAFQTNLLALNASVEAARAGDAGKGFAVVAVEVRRLAQSAAQASSEVKLLIEQSAGEVKTGSRLVGDAAGKLRTMLDAVRGNNGLLESIANDSREQAAAIAEVNSAVRMMDEMTQHNAALVEETNAALEQTEAQARELDRIVDIFHLPEALDGSQRQQPSRNEGARGLQRRLAAASSRFDTQGTAALSKDWDQF
ncbi:methyl-accepting chemotaxis protein [Devosia epidermidihirudinis]|uniref:methyl-accepting chemotaxis protein n=1 Tax=Devosia epidermidihirudinis TaxID=1293439 RepID=UPI0009E36215|nr:methyl-accepting chemotaxis protein [Devosia epidermidihirudinis]